MAPVAHSSLAGSNLHEPKGIAAATAGQVYIADGAASGAWTSTNGISGAFGNRLLHVRYQVGPTDANDNFYDNGVWSATILNTVVNNDISGATLVADTITLPAGDYIILGSVTTGDIGPRQLRLRDDTNNVTKVIGLRHSGVPNITLSIFGLFTLGATIDLALEVWSSDESSFNTLTDTGEDRVFTDVLIWKV